MKQNKRLFLIFFALFAQFSYLLQGQNVTTSVHLDSTHFFIGDYIPIHFEITSPKGSHIVIPQLNQEILTQSEAPYDWVSNSKIDTVPSENFVTYKQTVTLIAFDPGRYNFPSLPIFTADSIVVAQTEELYFEVITVAVDTTAAIKDIKQNINVPFTFHEFWLYVKEYSLYIILTIIIIALIIYLIIRYKKNHKNMVAKPVVKYKPKIKPHIVALKALEKLRHKKLWEQGKVKQYYSELTDIVRTYIDGRWDINAMEMVSKDIIKELEEKEIASEAISKLRETLSIADLVKFAKWDPLPNDHDIAFKSCREFVEETAEKIENTDSKKTKKD